MSNISELANVPDISFIENLTLQETEELLRSKYAEAYKALTGSDPEMGDADTKNLLFKAFSAIIYQVMQYIDAKGKAELLNTSTGTSLDALAALFGLSRKSSTRATATERFTLSEAQNETVAVPAGTRVKTESGRYYNTLEYAQIAPGETYVDVAIQAEEPGTESSGIQEGGISVLVDPIPYVASVSNITPSTGGMDVESDDALTERIWLAPSKFSCAGPRDAYIYYAKEWRGDVLDVQIVSTEPCEIEVYFTLADEENHARLPNATERASLLAYLSDESIRPLCDQVTCYAPTEVNYTINLTYWIAESDKKSAGTIQQKVANAVAQYQKWQRTMGRDINPTELIYRVRAAGAKRVAITAPADVTVSSTQLPKCTAATVAYGGLEND